MTQYSIPWTTVKVNTQENTVCFETRQIKREIGSARSEHSRLQRDKEKWNSKISDTRHITTMTHVFQYLNRKRERERLEFNR